MFKIREKVDAVKEIPRQIRITMQVAIGAIILAIVSIIVSIAGVRRAN